MTMIAVIDDDQTMRLMVTTVLRGSGYDVVEAADGAEGLALVRNVKPDCVVSDVQMPQMDGIAMLTAMRADAMIADIPVVMCTSLAERAHMRTGMVSGADDYVTKPFRMEELLEAVETQLRKRNLRDSEQRSELSRALDEQKSALMRDHEERLATELESRWLAGLENSLNAPAQQSFDEATVLYVDVLTQTTALLLTSEELSRVVKATYAEVSLAASAQGAHHIQLRGDGLLVVFAHATTPRQEAVSTNGTPAPHGLRALRAASAIAHSARNAYAQLREAAPQRHLPKATPRVALHSGSLTITSIEDGMRNSPPVVMCVGDTINKVVQLQQHARMTDWSITASDEVVQHVGAAALWSRSAAIAVGPKAQAMTVHEFHAIVSVGSSSAATNTGAAA